ncbi:hypothetical protein LEP1GSC029_2367 [Leptospira interrogans str. 2002000626]|uniref:Uncharacterized protein n=2 Tax=Leptospira interrogans TaxID=173 RepID=A0A829D113_LEPIR|nr:hypothetical protein LEP1GSC029_2367 [Leptospira interrogans str. 2002000626]EMY26311.1 hypothetical protein LEP1GSC115_5420 [Leptospira interrogans serovar Australis str. 200703203]
MILPEFREQFYRNVPFSFWQPVSKTGSCIYFYIMCSTVEIILWELIQCQKIDF